MQPLNVNLTTAADGGPLVVIDNLRGARFVEMRSAELRAMADALQRIDTEAEAHRVRGKRAPPPVRRDYPLPGG